MIEICLSVRCPLVQVIPSKFHDVNELCTWLLTVPHRCEHGRFLVIDVVLP
jgi:hypothetical protein